MPAWRKTTFVDKSPIALCGSLCAPPAVATSKRRSPTSANDRGSSLLEGEREGCCRFWDTSIRRRAIKARCTPRRRREEFVRAHRRVRHSGEHVANELTTTLPPRRTQKNAAEAASNEHDQGDCDGTPTSRRHHRRHRIRGANYRPHRYRGSRHDRRRRDLHRQSLLRPSVAHGALLR